MGSGRPMKWFRRIIRTIHISNYETQMGFYVIPLWIIEDWTKVRSQFHHVKSRHI
jgi:hypothetical protein